MLAFTVSSVFLHNLEQRTRHARVLDSQVSDEVSGAGRQLRHVLIRNSNLAPRPRSAPALSDTRHVTTAALVTVVALCAPLAAHAPVVRRVDLDDVISSCAFSVERLPRTHFFAS